jgi:cytosine/uracil/thiamine/allantoin permease
VLNDFVALLVAWSGPYAGVWLCDGVLRRWRFDLAAIHPKAGDVRAGGLSHWRAWAAYFAGMAAAVLTMRSPLYQGPLTRWLGGMDLSWVLGIAVSAGAYGLLLRGSRTRTAGVEALAARDQSRA